MFGSKKIQELEDKVRELTESLSKQQAENADLTRQLDSARSRIAGMEAQLNDFDLERAKEEAKASQAEFEGLKELYTRKNREFDEYKEGVGIGLTLSRNIARRLGGDITLDTNYSGGARFLFTLPL